MGLFSRFCIRALGEPLEGICTGSSEAERVRKRVIAPPSRALSSGSASEASADVTTLSGASPLRTISQQASAKPTENSGCGCTENVAPPA